MSETSQNDPLKKWVGDLEMDELNKLTKKNFIEVVNQDHLDTVISRLSDYTDIDKDKLLKFTPNELNFLYDQLNMSQIDERTENFYTRLERSQKLKDLMDKINKGEI